jgi:hypothetical protein
MHIRYRGIVGLLFCFYIRSSVSCVGAAIFWNGGRDSHSRAVRIVIIRLQPVKKGFLVLLYAVRFEWHALPLCCCLNSNVCFVTFCMVVEFKFLLFSSKKEEILVTDVTYVYLGVQLSGTYPFMFQ